MQLKLGYFVVNKFFYMFTGHILTIFILGERRLDRKCLLIKVHAGGGYLLPNYR
jgi:hypothetical protein